MSANWESEPATDRQIRKLRFYEQTIPAGLTKAEASALIDDAVSMQPEREVAYRTWADAQDDLVFWHQRAIDSDFCQEGDMSKPTREIVQQMIEYLDQSRPGWRDDMGENSFATQLMDHFPQLTRKA